MKKTLFFLIAVFVLSFILPAVSLHAATTLTDRQALDILIKQITKDKLYDEWTTLSCLSFRIEEEAKTYFDIAIHEKHDRSCPGDPDTYPIVDRYRVSRQNGMIQWYNREFELLPYKAVLKERGIKQKR